ncbi:amino acid ABC transporter permease [Anaerosacchariphilus polymeriproducens]|uniref:Amino acid ABC transporter permease n=1 Tax=Anaerosacchariphilus polymeriproducens TaxID=1812858 RepID=A0A371AXZ1_9FIRM|nr:amino acid ABC transporter permease [Anaerosacchariphilus polymeriproducens]RDU24433.1 amino acid ABC transporter permease [Anaerosacchariphilus polymeriproducens]
MELLHSIAEFFEIAFKNLPNFLPGIIATLLLSILSIVGGTLIGILVNLMKMAKVRPLVLLADIYVVIVRGTPLLLQLFFMFYCLPRMGINLDRFTSAVLGLSFHNGAYISEIFRGAILSIPKGQSEAAKAIGMTKLQSFRHVIFPQAFKNAVPALGNQFLLAIKDSSLASVITITETMMLARQLATATFSIFPIYFDAACIYMVLTYTLSFLLKKLEKRLRVNER